MLQWYQRGSWFRFPVRTDFSRRFGCITPLHPVGRPRCPDMGGKKVLETSTVNERRGIVAYGVQPGRIRRIYTDNSVYIIRCAVWRVSKIGRGLFSPVVKTPGCYTHDLVVRLLSVCLLGVKRTTSLGWYWGGVSCDACPTNVSGSSRDYDAPYDWHIGHWLQLLFV
jgi:hypothetical protein